MLSVWLSTYGYKPLNGPCRRHTFAAERATEKWAAVFFSTLLLSVLLNGVLLSSLLLSSLLLSGVHLSVLLGCVPSSSPIGPSRTEVALPIDPVKR